MSSGNSRFCPAEVYYPENDHVRDHVLTIKLPSVSEVGSVGKMILGLTVIAETFNKHASSVTLS